MEQMVVKRLQGRNLSLNAIESDLINNQCPVKLEYLFDMDFEA